MEERVPTGPRRARLGDQAGFTFIEVLVATIVLVVGIAGTAKLVAGSEAATLDSELQQLATEQAEQQLERVRGLPYSQVGHGATVPATVPEGGEELTATSYGGEQLVATVNETEAAGGTTGDGAGEVAGVQTFEVERGAGQPAVTGTIYTFVTWRDEECGVLNLNSTVPLADLETQLGALNSQVDAALADIATMTSSIDSTITAANSAYNALTAQLTGLLSNAATLKALIDTTGTADLVGYLNSLRTELTDLEDYLESLPIEETLNVIADLEALDLDLCDMGQDQFELLAPLLDLDAGGLLDLSTDLETNLATLDATLDPLNLPDVRTKLNNLTGLIPGALQSIQGIACNLLPNLCRNLLNPILGDALASALTAVDAAVDVFGTPQTPINTVSGVGDDVLAVRDSLLGVSDQLDLGLLSSNTTHNTKRVTVAVTLNTARDDITPSNPVWMSTVVTDQDAALLGVE